MQFELYIKFDKSLKKCINFNINLKLHGLFDKVCHEFRFLDSNVRNILKYDDMKMPIDGTKIEYIFELNEN